MFTYIIMAVPFFVITFAIDFWLLKTKVILRKKTWQVMLFLLIMTAIFDQFLTGLPIVLYNTDHTLGVKLGYAPIEDFTYTLAVVVLVGSIISYGEKNGKI